MSWFSSQELQFVELLEAGYNGISCGTYVNENLQAKEAEEVLGLSRRWHCRINTRKRGSKFCSYIRSSRHYGNADGVMQFLRLSPITVGIIPSLVIYELLVQMLFRSFSVMIIGLLREGWCSFLRRLDCFVFSCLWKGMRVSNCAFNGWIVFLQVS